MQGGWVYIMINRPNGTLTNDIVRRSWKTRLIMQSNPEWRDLYSDLF